MAFKRYAMSVISLIDTKGQKRVAFEDATDKRVVSFEYDPENYVYFRCRAISADVPNGNGDFFPTDELKKAYKSFIGVGMYKDHDSDSVDKSVGKVLWAEWVDEGKYVECYCCVDRKLDPGMARRIEMGQANTVSMGCMVGEAECSVPGCGNIAHNQLELCEHMIPGRGIKGKKGADGKIAHEINRMLQFTELSLVTVPADPTAHIFEVFAGLHNGTATVEQFRAALREELAAAAEKFAPTYVVSPSNTTANSNSSSTISITPSINMVPAVTVPSTASAEKEVGAVANIPDSTEEQMKLAISYAPGKSLADSFFVAKENGAEFRVAAADVLPHIVQEAIRTNQPGVAKPTQIVADLAEKCPSLADFKKWAKKRKKKNRKALPPFMEKKDDGAEDKKEEASAAAPAEAPAAPMAAGPADIGNSVMDPAPDAGSAVPEVPSAEDNQVSDAPGLEDLTRDEIQQTIEFLSRKLETLQTSLKGSPKKAVNTQKDLKVNKEMGESVNEHGSYSPAKEPAATSEVISASEPSEHRAPGKSDGKASPAPSPMKPGSMKSEEPKGYRTEGPKSNDLGGYAPAKIKAGQEKTMQKTAAEAKEPLWSMNSKELEAKPKMSKPAQAAPPADDVSWDSKEMASEQVKHESGSHSSKVKQFFGRLPSKSTTEPPRALDLKSNKDPEKEALKKRAEEAEAESKRLKEKENLQHVADKIYEIVKALREKNVLTADKEDEVVKLLATSFKELAHLDTVLGLAQRLAATEPSQETPEAGAPEVGSVVPQVFETVNQSEDAISTMARIWNL
jgi:hypothetical protein